ncbi:MAG: hypothetical protein Q9173_003549 [Seirophora scorigena]
MGPTLDVANNNSSGGFRSSIKASARQYAVALFSQSLLDLLKIFSSDIVLFETRSFQQRLAFARVRCQWLLPSRSSVSCPSFDSVPGPQDTNSGDLVPIPVTTLYRIRSFSTCRPQLFLTLVYHGYGSLRK